MKKDSYIEEVQETQGVIFEMICESDYDTEDFVNKFMMSKFKRRVDNRDAWFCTMNAEEQIQSVLNECEVKKGMKNDLDFVLLIWIGEFYALYQSKTKLTSMDIINNIPFNDLYNKANVLHDKDLELVVCETIEQRGDSFAK